MKILIIMYLFVIFTKIRDHDAITRLQISLTCRAPSIVGKLSPSVFLSNQPANVKID